MKLSHFLNNYDFALMKLKSACDDPCIVLNRRLKMDEKMHNTYIYHPCQVNNCRYDPGNSSKPHFCILEKIQQHTNKKENSNQKSNLLCWNV